MCTYLCKPWAVYVGILCEFVHWVCGESIKSLLTTAPVLKAGHPVSCSSLCILCVVCRVKLWFGLLRLWFWSYLCNASWLACYTHFSMLHVVVGMWSITVVL